MKVIVYVGLPKTATTFYQLKLFPYLKSAIIYNPNDIMERISYFLNLENIDSINKDEVNSFHKLIAQYQNKELKFNLVDFHSSRPGHDLRYSLSGDKMKELGWTPKISVKDRIKQVVDWSLLNSKWIEY